MLSVQIILSALLVLVSAQYRTIIHSTFPIDTPLQLDGANGERIILPIINTQIGSQPLKTDDKYRLRVIKIDRRPKNNTHEELQISKPSTNIGGRLSTQEVSGLQSPSPASIGQPNSTYNYSPIKPYQEPILQDQFSKNDKSLIGSRILLNVPPSEEEAKSPIAIRIFEGSAKTKEESDIDYGLPRREFTGGIFKEEISPLIIPKTSYGTPNLERIFKFGQINKNSTSGVKQLFEGSASTAEKPDIDYGLPSMEYTGSIFKQKEWQFNIPETSFDARNLERISKFGQKESNTSEVKHLFQGFSSTNKKSVIDYGLPREEYSDGIFKQEKSQITLPKTSYGTPDRVVTLMADKSPDPVLIEKGNDKQEIKELLSKEYVLRDFYPFPFELEDTDEGFPSDRFILPPNNVGSSQRAPTMSVPNFKPGMMKVRDTVFPDFVKPRFSPEDSEIPKFFIPDEVRYGFLPRSDMEQDEFDSRFLRPKFIFPFRNASMGNTSALALDAFNPSSGIPNSGADFEVTPNTDQNTTSIFGTADVSKRNNAGTERDKVELPKQPFTVYSLPETVNFVPGFQNILPNSGEAKVFSQKNSDYENISNREKLFKKQFQEYKPPESTSLSANKRGTFNSQSIHPADRYGAPNEEQLAVYYRNAFSKASDEHHVTQEYVQPIHAQAKLTPSLLQYNGISKFSTTLEKHIEPTPLNYLLPKIKPPSVAYGIPTTVNVLPKTGPISTSFSTVIALSKPSEEYGVPNITLPLYNEVSDYSFSEVAQHAIPYREIAKPSVEYGPPNNMLPVSSYGPPYAQHIRPKVIIPLRIPQYLKQVKRITDKRRYEFGLPVLKVPSFYSSYETPIY